MPLKSWSQQIASLLLIISGAVNAEGGIPGTVYCPTDHALVGWQYYSYNGFSVSDRAEWQQYDVHSPFLGLPENVEAAFNTRYAEGRSFDDNQAIACSGKDMSVDSYQRVGYKIRLSTSARSVTGSCGPTGEYQYYLLISAVCDLIPQPQPDDTPPAWCSSGSLKGWKWKAFNGLSEPERAQWTHYSVTKPLRLPNPGSVRRHVESVYPYDYRYSAHETSCGTSQYFPNVSHTDFGVGPSFRAGLNSSNSYCNAYSAQFLTPFFGPVCDSKKFFLQIPRDNDDRSCPTPDAGGASQGNPINIATGNKYQSEIDYQGPNALKLVRTYNSYDTQAGSLAVGWRHNYEKRLQFKTDRPTYQDGSQDNSDLFSTATAACEQGWPQIRQQMPGLKSSTATRRPPDFE